MRRSLLFGVAGFLAGALSGVVWRGDGHAKVIAMGDSASLSCEPATPGLKGAPAGLRNAVVVFPSDEAPRLQLDAESTHFSGCHWSAADSNSSFSRPLIDVWCVHTTGIPCYDTMAVADAVCSKDIAPTTSCMTQQGLQAAPAQRAPPKDMFPDPATARATCGIGGFVVKVALIMMTLAFAAAAAVIVLLAHRVARLADAVATSATMAVVTHTGSQLVKTALVSTEAGFTTCRVLAEAARLGADAALFGARCARESLAYVAFGVATPPSPTVPSSSLCAAARRGATMLQSAAAMREAAVNLTPAPLRVAIGVASSLMRPRQLVGPAAKPEMQAVGDAGGRPALADRMVPARPPQHHD